MHRISTALASMLAPLGIFGSVQYVAPVRAKRRAKKYPHSSTKQRARYARQLAAGQLNIQKL